jgi:type IV secretory pathway TrbL component
MFGINLKHSLAIVAVAVAVLAAAGSASAGTHGSGVVLYDGHAGLGASAYQHDQTDLEFLAFSP